MKSIFPVIVFCCLFLVVQAGKRTSVSVEVSGWKGNEIQFGFVEEPVLTMQFPYVEDQLIEFEVELTDITMMKINGWVAICLQPGDSIRAKVVYEGEVYKTVDYSGSPQAVVAATFLHQVREMRRERNYKSSGPAAWVTRIPVQTYYDATLKEWKDELALLEQVKGQLSEQLYSYLKSEVEGTLLPGLLVYPYAYADGTKQDIRQILPEGYGEVLDDYELREDDGSLRNRKYISFFTPYKAYMKSKKAGTPEAFTLAGEMEQEYAEMAAFYGGKVRDAALFALLYDAILTAKDMKTVERLKKEYQKKYNVNKTYRTTLDALMK